MGDANAAQRDPTRPNFFMILLFAYLALRSFVINSFNQRFWLTAVFIDLYLKRAQSLVLNSQN
jgi:hypothetical protein